MPVETAGEELSRLRAEYACLTQLLASHDGQATQDSAVYSSTYEVIASMLKSIVFEA
jgi:hypothetical protein